MNRLAYLVLILAVLQSHAFAKKRSLGTQTQIDELPALCRIEQKAEGSNDFVPFCSGSVTGDHEITTAAHCRASAGAEIIAKCGPKYDSATHMTLFTQTLHLKQFNPDLRFQSANGASAFDLATFQSVEAISGEKLTKIRAQEMEDGMKCKASGFGLNEELKNMEQARYFDFPVPSSEDRKKSSWSKKFTITIDQNILKQDQNRTQETMNRLKEIMTPELMRALQSTPDLSTPEGVKRDQEIQQKFFFPLLQAIQPVAQIEAAITPGDSGGPVWCENSKKKKFLIGVSSTLSRTPLSPTSDGGFTLGYVSSFAAYTPPAAGSSGTGSASGAL